MEEENIKCVVCGTELSDFFVSLHYKRICGRCIGDIKNF